MVTNPLWVVRRATVRCAHKNMSDAMGGELTGIAREDISRLKDARMYLINPVRALFARVEHLAVIFVSVIQLHLGYLL